MAATRLTPWQTLLSLIESWSLSELGWIFVTLGGIFLFYNIAMRRKRNTAPTFGQVLFWLICCCGWIFLMFMLGWSKIYPGGWISFALLGLSAIFVTITCYVLTKKSRIWEIIISGVVIAIVGFSIIAAFGAGSQSIGIAIVFGTSIGALLGLLTSTYRALSVERHNVLTEPAENIYQEKDAPKRPPL